MQRMPKITLKRSLNQIRAQKCPWPLHGYLVRAKRARDTRAVPMGILEHDFFEGLFLHGFWASSPWVSSFSS